MVELSKEEFVKILKETVQAEMKAFKEQEAPDERTTFIGTCMKGGKSMEDCAKEWDAKQQATTEVTEALKKYPAEIHDAYKKMLAEGKPLADVKKLLEAEWDTEFINNLPDNAFATIGAGGEKDADGKTVPRSLRHLPFKNAQGNIDVPHLRNALARLSQIESGSQAEAKKKLCAAAKEVDLASEACGLTESAYLVGARKEIVDLKAKVADAEKKLNEAKAETLTLAKTVEAQIPQDQGLRFFNPAAKRVVEDIKRTLLPFKESK